MKKAITLILALVMCLSLIPLAAMAYGNERIQLDKDNYDPNETMKITIKGVTQQMVDDWACVGIYKKDFSSNIGSYPQIMSTGDYSIDYVEAPAEPGEYAVVFLSKWWQNGSFSELLVSSLPFTVGKVAQAGNISLDKTSYTALNPITVSYSGITQQMINAKAFVRIHGKGANQSSYGALPLTQSSGTITINAPNQNGEFEMRLYSVDDGNWNATTEHLVMSVPFTLSGAVGSGWAQNERVIEKAIEMEIFPDRLKGQDLARPITRAEFAAVAVLLYQNLTGKTAVPTSPSPFTDTSDPEVLKAHRLGIIQGLSATRFAPNDRLTREQMAAMMTRTLKTAYIDDWTLANDGNFALNYTMPQQFNDHALIGAWARESVYFMASHGIIQGSGGNFRPRAASTTEAAIAAATSTREQALAIAVRMVENLKDKPLDYK